MVYTLTIGSPLLLSGQPSVFLENLVALCPKALSDLEEGGELRIRSNTGNITLTYEGHRPRTVAQSAYSLD